MILLFAHHYDAEAEWFFHELKKSCQLPVVWLIPEALGVDYSITLRFLKNGQTTGFVLLRSDERRLEMRDVRYAINRFAYIDPLIWEHAEPSEKAYAASELNAFFPAVIQSLTRSISKRIDNGSLCDINAFVAGWATRFHSAGISVDISALRSSGDLQQVLIGRSGRQVFRFLYDVQRVFTPVGQTSLTKEAEIKTCLRTFGDDETLEALFICESGLPQLIHVSKTPALSCYGLSYVDTFVRHVLAFHNDPSLGETQRNASRAAS